MDNHTFNGECLEVFENDSKISNLTLNSTYSGISDNIESVYTTSLTGNGVILDSKETASENIDNTNCEAPLFVFSLMYVVNQSSSVLNATGEYLFWNSDERICPDLNLKGQCLDATYDYRALIEDSNNNEYMSYSNQSYNCDVLYCSKNSQGNFTDYESTLAHNEVCSLQKNADDYALTFTSTCSDNASTAGSIGNRQYCNSNASNFTITYNSLEANLPVKLASNAEDTSKMCYSIEFNSNTPASKDYLKSIHADRGEIPLGCDSLADEFCGENVLTDSIQVECSVSKLMF